MIRMARVGVRARQRPRRPGQLRPRRARHRRPGEPRPGHAGRPALLRHRRRRADDPALRLVLRRQRAARQDRPRPAPGRLRRLGVGRVPRRAVHAARHHRQGDRPQVPHLRRLPERVGQDQPGDDAGARRPRRPLPRRVLRRRHRVAAGRPRGRPDLRDQPRVRRLRRRQGHQRGDQPDRARRRSPPGTGTIFTNVAYNDEHRTRSGGRARRPSRRPTSTGWRDWKGDARSPSGRRRATGDPWAHPNSRFTTTLANVPEHRAGLRRPARACRSTRSSSAAAPATASR